jgi:hypothetical protein
MRCLVSCFFTARWFTRGVRLRRNEDSAILRFSPIVAPVSIPQHLTSMFGRTANADASAQEDRASGCDYQ